MKTRNTFLILAIIMTMVPTLSFAAESGMGCGDVFGDLIHIKRDAATGQPILQKRWIEYPQDLYDWGYCPIPVTETGEEIPFIDLTCDPADVDAVVEVDYFGRLNAGRTKERNNRMHFNEVISTIKSAEQVREDKTGRLRMGYDCDPDTGCAEWSTIDSPQENLALYTRLMKYGHLQTDPMEEDVNAHGDPAAGIQYHPALGPEDWEKFGIGLLHLLPRSFNCFAGGDFHAQCAEPEALENRDIIRSSSFLAGAANKTGRMTADLVQYMNRVLKITQDTEMTVATLHTLPALIRDCGDDPDNQLPYEQCAIVEASPDLPFPANERFVDFTGTKYFRDLWRDKNLKILVPITARKFRVTSGVPLMAWLEFANGPVDNSPIMDIQGFIAAASDGLRAIEFVHNYEVPADLGWDFQY